MLHYPIKFEKVWWNTSWVIACIEEQEEAEETDATTICRPYYVQRHNGYVFRGGSKRTVTMNMVPLHLRGFTFIRTEQAIMLTSGHLKLKEQFQLIWNGPRRLYAGIFEFCCIEFQWHVPSLQISSFNSSSLSSSTSISASPSSVHSISEEQQCRINE